MQHMGIYQVAKICVYVGFNIKKKKVKTKDMLPSENSGNNERENLHYLVWIDRRKWALVPCSMVYVTWKYVLRQISPVPYVVTFTYSNCVLSFTSSTSQRTFPEARVEKVVIKNNRSTYKKEICSKAYAQMRKQY